MIYISAGHNGLGTGSHGLIDEAAETIKVRNQIVENLKALGVPAESICQDADQASLKTVIADVNAKCRKASRDIAIELHFNSNGKDTEANGTETFVANVHSEKSARIAKDLNETITKTLGTRDRTNGEGYKTERQSAHKVLGFLRQVNCPSVIVEICFVKNQADIKAYKDNWTQLCLEMATSIKRWHK